MAATCRFILARPDPYAGHAHEGDPRQVLRRFPGAAVSAHVLLHTYSVSFFFLRQTSTIWRLGSTHRHPARFQARCLSHGADAPVSPSTGGLAGRVPQDGHGGAAAAEPFSTADLGFTPECLEIVADAMPYFRPYSPITLFYHALDSMKLVTGLPWWAVVAGATVTARLLMMPVVIYTMKNGARMALVKPEMDAIQARFKSEQRSDPGVISRMRAACQLVNCCLRRAWQRRGSGSIPARCAGIDGTIQRKPDENAARPTNSGLTTAARSAAQALTPVGCRSFMW